MHNKLFNNTNNIKSTFRISLNPQPFLPGCAAPSDSTGQGWAERS